MLCKEGESRAERIKPPETLRFESRREEGEGVCQFFWGKNVLGPKVGPCRGCVGHLEDLALPGRAPCLVHAGPPPVFAGDRSTGCWACGRQNCLPPGPSHVGFVILGKLRCCVSVSSSLQEGPDPGLMGLSWGLMK